MKTKLIILVAAIIGFVVGIVFAGIVLSISAKNMLMKELRSPFDFDKTVEVMVERINAADGWNVTDVIDQDAVVQSNGGKPIGKYKIIKYCHGGFSSRMLGTDDRKMMGNMMPKTFAVYEKSDGRVFVTTMNGAVMGKILGGETEDIIEEVSLDVEKMMRFINLKYTLF